MARMRTFLQGQPLLPLLDCWTMLLLWKRRLSSLLTVDPPFEEALGDNEEDDGDKFRQDDTLWASSTFSLPEAGVDPTAMVDPSESDWVCLDRMG